MRLLNNYDRLKEERASRELAKQGSDSVEVQQPDTALLSLGKRKLTHAPTLRTNSGSSATGSKHGSRSRNFKKGAIHEPILRS